jgi:uncharacterized protein YdhG (YjbR/CyaY superfamily)
MAKMKKYGTVEEYLADQPKEVRETLQHVRESVLSVAPNATEKIGYGMPGSTSTGARSCTTRRSRRIAASSQRAGP